MSSDKNIAAECRFNPGDTIDSRWRVDTLLGEGTYGAVYKVQDHRSQIFALKILKLWMVAHDDRESLQRRFDREYQTGLIDCPNLVRSVSQGRIYGNPYFVMEYCGGGDLVEATRRGGLDMTRLCTDILHGLDALHRQGKVHRDLKPGNVLLRTDGTAVLTDFGIAGDQNNRMTRRGFFGAPKEQFGTMAYMPPEQVNPRRGNATVLPTTDIYSFGVMVYQLLTGRLPFGTVDDEQSTAKYVYLSSQGKYDTAPLLADPDTRQWLRLIECCLEPDYRRRLQNVAEVLKYLPGYDPAKHLRPAPAKGTSLHIITEQGLASAVPLPQPAKGSGSVVTIGRLTGQAWSIIEIDSNSISRFHATLECDPLTHRWLLRDGQWRDDQWHTSTNGTYLNNTPISAKGQWLKHGDNITLGTVKITFEDHR